MEYAEVPDYFPYPALDAAGYRQKMDELMAMYPWEIHLTQLNLISSHDIARALTVMGEDEASMELAVLLQMTFPGAPCIYYGDEVGLPGGLDPDCRRVFPAEKDWNHPLLKHHKALISLRHQHPALQTGHYTPLIAEGKLYGFERRQAEEAFIVLVNAGDEDVQIDLQSHLDADKGSIKTLYGPLQVVSGSTVVKVPSRSGGIVNQLPPA
jgi:glycosidase